jgi:hypothetical protein
MVLSALYLCLHAFLLHQESPDLDPRRLTPHVWGGSVTKASRYVSTRVPRSLHAPIDFVAQPTNHRPLSFEAQTKKPLRWFGDLNHQTVAAGFEALIRKPEATGFEVKPGETIDLGFEAKPRNPRFSSPYAWCISHTSSPDLSIIWPSSTRLMLDHPWFSASGLLLPPWSLSLPAMSHLSPAHHETSKHDSLHKIDGVEPSKLPKFELKPRQINYSSQSNKGTDHLVSQSTPWWVHW